MATKKAPAKKAAAKTAKPANVNPETSPTDKDLQEGAIQEVVETPSVVLGESSKGEKVGPLRVNVYAANVRRKHLTPGAKDDYEVQVKIYAQPNKPADLEAVKEGAVELVNDASSLDLSLKQENVTVKLTLLDSYISE